ncbi:hypothetical protein SY86_10650 [Erwinia tracheiphila]|uniref:Uncharacterized protein n=1 Tax=Erwinia tracheiphila TaxID=65700 RepID=A0A0M2KA21_9GAMM|nr:hypothetical protein AV903_05305 [Erwinia tracheiphila]EOS93191.1 hypothetical protein ETR_20308 [Erwinia tracheiphila PSU-1]KKF35779.1 hypothetical protein SY86_10650 [Erwinia tracheiphila]
MFPFLMGKQRGVEEQNTLSQRMMNLRFFVINAIKNIKETNLIWLLSKQMHKRGFCAVLFKKLYCT